MHDDIRPSNLLLNDNDHLKVVDFDNTIKTRFEFDDCQSLYARVLSEKDANKRETFECHDSRIEQFVIDLVFYYMTRDFELYDNE
jgi:serine/threonine protein kinase